MTRADDDYNQRFGGIARLYGVAALERLRNGRVAVIGVGGVGCWTVEALARSGVGHITMVDLDEVCLNNTNRQLHALDGNVGRSKVEALAERVKRIQPTCDIREVEAFYTAKTADAILAPTFDIVIDAFDSANLKCHLIAECRRRSQHLLVIGGAGGRRDATQVQVVDLTKAIYDPLLSRVRKKLRQEHGFPRKGRFKIPCVFTPERPVYPTPEGEVCERPPRDGALRLDCSAGYGAATSLTGTFGFVAAQVAIETIIGKPA